MKVWSTWNGGQMVVATPSEPWIYLQPVLLHHHETCIIHI